MSMRLPVLFGLVLFAPVTALRKRRELAVAGADCDALSGLVVGGQDFGKTIKFVCQGWPPSMGKFPIDDIARARELLEKVMKKGGAWDQIKKIREEMSDRGFCWRNLTVRDNANADCPLGYLPTGLPANFRGSCFTGCMYSTHPLSCGFGCGESRLKCNSAILEQVKLVAQGVAAVYGFVTGDERIGKAVAALIKLSDFLLESLPPIIDAVRGAIDILGAGHGAYVAVVLFQYLVDTAPEVKENAEAILAAIQEFGDIIAELVEEKIETGKINYMSIINEVLDHGEEMLDFAVRATKAFTHPTCAIADNVAFTIENAGDDRLLGPWVQRGEIQGHPRYTRQGDRKTNLEWSKTRWVMFSDGWSGIIGRKFLYESSVRSNDYPTSGWTLLNGTRPVPEFVPVAKRLE